MVGKYRKNIRIISYIEYVKKQAAFEANTIKVLTIAKSDDPSLHLNFWQENLRSD